LIGQARYDDNPKRYSGFEIKRGELVTSLSNISEDNQHREGKAIKKWSRSKISRMLKRLEDEKYISILADTYGTHINICNYEIYQDFKTYKADSYESKMKRQRNDVETKVKTTNKDNKDNTVTKANTSAKLSNKFSEDTDQIKLAKLLYEKIIEHRTIEPPKFQFWAKDIEAINKKLNKTWVEIEHAIIFSQLEENLSASSLREKFNKLITAKERQNVTRENKSVSPNNKLKQYAELRKIKEQWK
jgi:hypothetical protein